MDCSLDSFSETILKELETYSQDVTEEIKTECKRIAKECVEEVKTLSPSRTGQYRSGWKAKKVYEDDDDIRCVVYNSKKPQLTHLIENGYLTNNGSVRVEGRPHISVVEKNAISKMMLIAKQG